MIHDDQMVVIADGTSMAADFESLVHEIHGFDCGSLVVNWTGANATTARLIPQFSNDLVCWCNWLAESDAERVDDVSGCKMYFFETFCFKYIRLRFLKKTNSAGTVTVTSYAKRWYQQG